MDTPEPTTEGVASALRSAGGSLALGVLVGLVVLSPWPFGSVHPRATRAIVLVALVTALATLVWPLLDRRHGAPAPGLGSWHASMAVLLALGLWLLGAVQLLPLPRGLHALLAPGSAAVWHPVEPAAAVVLGPGPHPISLFPAATCRWLAFLGAMIGLVTAAAPALRERRAMLRAAVAIVAGAVVVALYAFVARLWFGDRLFGVYESLIRPFGPFVSKNHFAGYVEMAALLAVGLATGLASENRTAPGLFGWIESPRASRVVLAWAAAAVLVLAVPVSLSRGGVVSLAVGLVTFAALRIGTRLARGSLIPIAAALAALAVAFAAVHLVLPERARARIATIGEGGGDSSSAYRLGLWRDSIRLMASSPLVGSGFGAFADAIPRFKTGAGDVRVEHAENDWLELLAEGGLAGAVLGGGAVALILTAGWRGVRGDPHRLSRGIRTGALAGLVALGVHGVFDFNLHIPSNALLAGLLAALVLAPVSGRSLSEDDAVDALRLQASPFGPGATTPRRLAWSGGIAAVAGISLALSLAVRWSEDRGLSDGLTAHAGSLRRTATERDVVARVRERPAGAEAWLVLAWLRTPTDPTAATGLAGRASRLDPTNERLISAARRLSYR